MKLDCKKYADKILQDIKDKPKRGYLAIIQVGDDEASNRYVRGKIADAKKCNVEVVHDKQPKTTFFSYMRDCITELNGDPKCGGIIVQLPLPDHLPEERITNMVKQTKDVDGFVHNSKFKPCTPEAIIWLMKERLGDLTGKNVLLIGRGKLIGKPLIKLLLEENCTLTICHSKTVNIRKHIEDRHDVIITGVGKQMFDMHNANADLIIDAGITFNNGKIGGDCYGFSDSFVIYDYVTSPNGIGLLTRAMLMKHMVVDDE